MSQERKRERSSRLGYATKTKEAGNKVTSEL